MWSSWQVTWSTLNTRRIVAFDNGCDVFYIHPTILTDTMVLIADNAKDNDVPTWTP